MLMALEFDDTLVYRSSMEDSCWDRMTGSVGDVAGESPVIDLPAMFRDVKICC